MLMLPSPITFIHFRLRMRSMDFDAMMNKHGASSTTNFLSSPFVSDSSRVRIAFIIQISNLRPAIYFRFVCSGLIRFPGLFSSLFIAESVLRRCYIDFMVYFQVRFLICNLQIRLGMMVVTLVKFLDLNRFQLGIDQE